jgi:SprT-like family
MFRNTDLREIMREDLPNIAYQKRLMYRTDLKEVQQLYRLINKQIFNNQLEMPFIEVAPRCRKYWGICFGDETKKGWRQSYCKIKLMDKWYCRQWLVTILAHEMCHQYQWDIIGEERLKQGKDRLMSHGPSFFIFRDKLAKHGISLKTSHSKRRWFKHQNLFKA